MKITITIVFMILGFLNARGIKETETLTNFSLTESPEIIRVVPDQNSGISTIIPDQNQYMPANITQGVPISSNKPGYSFPSNNVEMISISKPVNMMPIVTPTPVRQSAPKFIAFGKDQMNELKFQNLLSKILNYGLLNMFTDLTDQATRISLVTVLKQIQQIAGKDIYKVIFKVMNNKYSSGATYYGVEFAISGGMNNGNGEDIDFISFGKSVILRNVLNMLSLNERDMNSSGDLTLLNTTLDAAGHDFSSQSKTAMIQFINTILNLTGSRSSPSNSVTKEKPSSLIMIGSGNKEDTDVDLGN